jgi:hypothetical protein
MGERQPDSLFSSWSIFRDTNFKSGTRYRGDYQQKSFSCWDQFLTMGFGRFTYRESLRDIEACLRAASLSHGISWQGIALRRIALDSGGSQRVPRLEGSLRIFAQVLIGAARPLYADNPIGVGSGCQPLCAGLDSTTLDLCLSLFSRARL